MITLDKAEALKTARSASSPEPDISLGSVLLLLFGSGCAALIYEVVWFQQLQLVIGSSAISLGLLLATYMGGLFLGSIALPRLISARHHPLFLYSMMEFGIGVLGLLILWGLPFVGSLYVTGAVHGLSNLLLRGTMCAACVLPPTILMGASFPIISRWIEPTKIGVSRMGWLYAANIAGGVCGCLSAGFYFLRVYNLAVATYVAVALNILVAVAGLGLAASNKHDLSTRDLSKDDGKRIPGAVAIYIAIALSGLSALGAQVVWTRLLALLFGTTVYTFSIILAMFLIGLGSGSGIGSLLARWTDRPRLMFGICQVLLAASVAWAAWIIAKSLPYWPIASSLGISPWFDFQLDIFLTLWTVLPAAVLWGASFPLALASLAVPTEDSGWLVARIYGANTLGAIVGALVFTLILVPETGTMHSQQILIAVPGFAALALLAPFSYQSDDRSRREGAPGWQRLVTFAIFVIAIFCFAGTVSDVPWQLLAYGRRITVMMYSDRQDPDPVKLLYRGEGVNSSVVITDQAGLRILYVNGNTEASNAIDDMRLQRLDGHIPALIDANPQDVFVLGFGTGTTAGSFVTYPSVKKIVIAELEPLVPRASGEFFRNENYGVLDDPRTSVVYDDGRHYLLTHKERFDVITADPVHLWVAGTSALYSREFFETVRRHLKPGGVVAQWLPLYDGDVDTIKSVLATFFEVFPNGTVWSNHTEDRGYDLILLGQAGPTKINVDALQQRLDQPDYSAVINSLRAVGFKSETDILATYLGQATELKPWLSGAQINSDQNLRLQYLAGLTMNTHVSEYIYRLLLAHREFPQDLFEGSDQSLQPLRSLLTNH